MIECLIGGRIVMMKSVGVESNVMPTAVDSLVSCSPKA